MRERDDLNREALHEVWTDEEWRNTSLFVGNGPRGSAVQSLYVNGMRFGDSYVVADEVSGEFEAQ